MESFSRLFGSLLVFVYHCFDRIVIHGYLSGLSRPEQVVYFFRDVLGIPVDHQGSPQQADRAITATGWRPSPAITTSRSNGPKKESAKRITSCPGSRRMERADAYGVYFIFQSMEQGPHLPLPQPKYPTEDPNHRILAHPAQPLHPLLLLHPGRGPGARWSCAWRTFFPFQTTYWLNGHSFIERELKRLDICFRKDDNAFLASTTRSLAGRRRPAQCRDHPQATRVLDPDARTEVFQAASERQMNLQRFYAIAQVEYCRNFIFKRHFPIRKIFERSCEIGLWRMTARKISEIFGIRVTKRLRGKLHTTLDRIEHGHHVFRAYFKNAFVKQYEKFSTFLRNEICSNNLDRFRPQKGPGASRRCAPTLPGRSPTALPPFRPNGSTSTPTSPCWNVWLAPSRGARPAVAGIKIHDTRMIRLMEVLLDAGTRIGGWSARQIHHDTPGTLPDLREAYGFNQLRYDLRKIRAHGLLERDRPSLRLCPDRKRNPNSPAIRALSQAPFWSPGPQPVCQTT